MTRLLICLLYPLLLTPIYLAWSRDQAEAQIDKMQQAVFDTPGSEAPIPPVVVVGGIGLLAGYGLLGWALRLPGWVRWAGLMLGLPLGVAVHVLRQSEQ